ncbi:MAG: hypothetical protein MK289_24020, partial [Trichodesmium sp. ALOHA_ZT_67]|nr:hypothetical protein [Trichodesmium sp. ALOHA_ZT_67]
ILPHNLNYSSAPEGKSLYIYSFRLACHPVRFATLEELRKLIDAINWSLVPPVSSAAKRNPWFANNTHATDFFVFYRINLFNLLAQILIIIYISFCTI